MGLRKHHVEKALSLVDRKTYNKFHVYEGRERERGLDPEDSWVVAAQKISDLLIQCEEILREEIKQQNDKSLPTHSANKLPTPVGTRGAVANTLPTAAEAPPGLTAGETFPNEKRVLMTDAHEADSKQIASALPASKNDVGNGGATANSLPTLPTNYVGNSATGANTLPTHQKISAQEWIELIVLFALMSCGTWYLMDSTKTIFGGDPRPAITIEIGAIVLALLAPRKWERKLLTGSIVAQVGIILAVHVSDIGRIITEHFTLKNRLERVLTDKETSAEAMSNATDKRYHTAFKKTSEVASEKEKEVQKVEDEQMKKGNPVAELMKESLVFAGRIAVFLVSFLASLLAKSILKRRDI